MVANGTLQYTKIFQSNDPLLKHIENYLSDVNRWQLNDLESDNQYEVFMKLKQQKFKGFAVIFQEGWIKNQQQAL